ncbi:MAG TPA: SCO family protein [Rhizomicrobium sp.]|nr:SCO family protein [Rhizomicrobium sp.]
MRRTSTVLLLCALVLAVAASVALWRLSDRYGPGSGTAAIGGPFVLTDQNGHPRSDRDFHGRFVLLYFGYSFCPDVCPTTLAKIASALGKLGPQADRFVPIFITVDPARDTPSVLKSYLAAFGPQFVGLTGKPSDIAKVAHSYRVYYAKHPLAGGNYAMDHSSVIYLLDPDGNFVKAYDDDASPAALADDLKKQL